MNYANEALMNLFMTLLDNTQWGDKVRTVRQFFETYEVNISIRQPVAEDLKEKRENDN